MTILQLRDRCNELLAGQAMPSYETGVRDLFVTPGKMTITVESLSSGARITALQDAELKIREALDIIEEQTQ